MICMFTTVTIVTIVPISGWSLAGLRRGYLSLSPDKQVYT